MKITEEQIDTFIDLFMMDRGDHPTRLRNPIYGEERQLAKKVAQAVAELTKKNEDKTLLKFLEWRNKQNLLTLHDLDDQELINAYLKNHF